MMSLSILTKTTIISIVAASAFMATPAMAASNGEVEKCRTAMAEQGDLDIAQYRLRFERQEGQRTKTLHFKAIPDNGGEAIDVTCTIKRSKVLALNTGKGEITLFAKNDKK